MNVTCAFSQGLETKAAVTAAAHKPARILRAMVKHRRSNNPGRLGHPEPARARNSVSP
jgi:hypothetical protein